MSFSATNKLLLLVLISGLAACAAPIPREGELVHLEMRERVTQERLRNGWTANIRNALQHGTSREDLQNGRVVTAICAERTAAGVVERSWWVKVPPTIRFTGSIHMREFAELKPGTPKDHAGPLGEVLSKSVPPHESELLPLPYPGKRVACNSAGTPGAVRAEVISASSKRWVDELDFEDAWIRRLPAEKLEDNRVFTAICALGTDSFEYWYVEIGPDQAFQRGQVVKARAGSSISSGPGALSQVLGRAPGGYETAKVFGSELVRCSQ